MKSFIIFVLSCLFFKNVVCEEQRIVGGSEAEEGEFPYQVSLRQGKHHFCGGSILNETWILTAAHCVQGQESEDVIVVVGSNYLSEGGDRYEVETLLPHEMYSGQTISNDIALVKLKDTIKYSSRIRAINLPNEDTPDGTELVLSGWGRTSYPGKIPDKLQTIKLVSISNLKCNIEHATKTVLSTNICTFTEKGQGACHGDSGGPLVQDDVQVGVVSWGIPCAKGKPDVFTRVFPYLEWIEKNME